MTRSNLCPVFLLLSDLPVAREKRVQWSMFSVVSVPAYDMPFECGGVPCVFCISDGLFGACSTL